MIKKLKAKFIVLCMISLFVLLAVLVIGMNILNYTSVTREADDILLLLSRNRGMFPEFSHGRDEHLEPDIGKRQPKLDMSPELPYESRYFSVLMNNDGTVVYADTSRISAVDTQTAISYAKDVLESGETSGFEQSYRYSVTEEDGAYRITFLDCGRQLDAALNFLIISCTIAVMGLVVVFAVISVLSGKILRPIVESDEKQRRFITDAGPEIKTPLTIINANVDLLKMDGGESEALCDIKQQTVRLAALTEELVYLAKMEEGHDSLKKIEFPVSDVVLEIASSFKALAVVGNKSLECNVKPMLSMVGDVKAIERLLSVVLDNALKYSDKRGRIILELTSQNKNIIVTVENTCNKTLSKEEMTRVFDRFYRSDPSRNSEYGGHGIGLSVAKAIVISHGGKIRAYSRKEGLFAVEIILPVN